MLAGLFFVLVAVLTAALPAPRGPVAPLCTDDPQEAERARALVQQGLERALIEHTQHLFDVWLRDDVTESRRAANGVRNGMRAFFHARRQIEAMTIPHC